jgi:hypothetical protein
LKIQFQLQNKSYISNWQFSKSGHSVRYVSCHNVMAYARIAKQPTTTKNKSTKICC